MRVVVLVVISAGIALAQGTSPAPTAPSMNSPATGSSAAAKPPGTSVSPNAAVITIKGVCPASTGAAKSTSASATKSASRADCKTVITRAEFEQLCDLLQVPPPSRRQFANQYATAIIMANEAHKRGLDSGARYQQLVKLARLQVSARQLAQNLQEQSGKISDKEVADYYHNNQAAYQEATLERLYIPRAQQQETPKEKPSDADAKKAEEQSEAAMKKEADDLRARASGGEDFTKLQTEAYKFAKFTATPPPVKMEKTRATSLPAAQRGVLDMKQGEVSQVFSDPSGYFVYKLDQKDMIPLDRVHDEIHAALQRQKMQDSSQAIQQSAMPSFNDAYFSSATGGLQSRQMPGSHAAPPTATEPK